MSRKFDLYRNHLAATIYLYIQEKEEEYPEGVPLSRMYFQRFDTTQWSLHTALSNLVRAGMILKLSTPQLKYTAKATRAEVAKYRINKQFADAVKNKTPQQKPQLNTTDLLPGLPKSPKGISCVINNTSSKDKDLAENSENGVILFSQEPPKKKEHTTFEDDLFESLEFFGMTGRPGSASGDASPARHVSENTHP